MARYSLFVLKVPLNTNEPPYDGQANLFAIVPCRGAVDISSVDILMV